MKSRQPNSQNTRLKNVHSILLKHFGPQHWWPAQSPLEIIVGCILTQNTAWTNVEKAISALKQAGFLPSQKKLLQLNPYFKKILLCPQITLAEYLRPTGYFKQKSGYLLAFMQWLQANHGGFDQFYQSRKSITRDELLSVKGIGPETADSILLYCLKQAEFVVDTYTRRIFSRHGLLGIHDNYDEVKKLFTQAIAIDEGLYNEYHALIVNTGKNFCKRTRPLCSLCPLNGYHRHNPHGPTTDRT